MTVPRGMREKKRGQVYILDSRVKQRGRVFILDNE